MTDQDRNYFLARARTERDLAAKAASSPVRAAHERLASAYEERANSIEEGPSAR